MADLLSQSEIDNLLQSLQGDGLQNLEENDDTNEKKVKVYDFKSANKFSKEQIKILHNIYDNFSQLLSTSLSGNLRTNCQVEIISVEEQIYYDYINSLPSPVVLAILNIQPMGSPTLMEISSIVACELISRLLGGNGGRLETSRNYTEIDLALLEKTVSQFTRLIDTSWSKVLKVKAVFDRIETSPQFAQIISYNETIAIITFRVKIGDDVEGFINVCIPHIAIDPIAKQLNTNLWYTHDKMEFDERNARNIRKEVNNSKVDVVVSFNDTTARVGDIIDLKVGDVLQLVHKVDEKLTVKICESPKFLGELGVMRNKYVVKITETIKEAQSENE